MFIGHFYLIKTWAKDLAHGKEILYVAQIASIGKLVSEYAC